MKLKKRKRPINPYEDAVRWIEAEVLKHGVFKMENEMASVYDKKRGFISSMPTGKFVGFTCSSQHVRVAGWNLLQLVAEMKRLEKDKPWQVK